MKVKWVDSHRCVYIARHCEGGPFKDKVECGEGLSYRYDGKKCCIEGLGKPTFKKKCYRENKRCYCEGYSWNPQAGNTQSRDPTAPVVAPPPPPVDKESGCRGERADRECQ